MINALDIDADRKIPRQRNEREFAGMGKIEPEVSRVRFLFHFRFSHLAVYKLESLWIEAKIASQNSPQHAPCDDVTIPVSWKMKAIRPDAFIRREQRVAVDNCSVRFCQLDTPDVNLPRLQ